MIRGLHALFPWFRNALTAAWEPVSLRPAGCSELGDTRQTPQELTRHPCKGVGVKVSCNGFDLKPKAPVVSTKQSHGIIYNMD